MKDTEVMSRLYLELSQFVDAKTAREIKMENAMREAIDLLNEDDAAENLGVIQATLYTALPLCKKEKYNCISCGVNLPYSHPYKCNECRSKFRKG